MFKILRETEDLKVDQTQYLLDSIQATKTTDLSNYELDMLAGKSRTINDEEDKEHEDLNKQIREFFWDIICNTS